MYPDPLGAPDRRDFERWTRHTGASEHGVPATLDVRASEEPFVAHPLSELELPGLAGRGLRSTPLELCVRAKPLALAALLDAGYAGALFLDPDQWVLGDLEPLWSAIEHSAIVLTPHLVAPPDGTDAAAWRRCSSATRRRCSRGPARGGGAPLGLVALRRRHARPLVGGRPRWPRSAATASASRPTRWPPGRGASANGSPPRPTTHDHRSRAYGPGSTRCAPTSGRRSRTRSAATATHTRAGSGPTAPASTGSTRGLRNGSGGPAADGPRLDGATRLCQDRLMAAARSILARQGQTARRPSGFASRPPTVRAGVLQLQRLAGNRAVCHLLRQPAPLLGGLDATTRQKMQVATANVPPDFADEETFARKAPKELKGVTIQYGAKVPADTNLRTGLQVLAWDMLDPAGHKPDMESPFRDNSTVTLELDLKQFKGEDGLWQFTYTTTGTPAKHQLLIDYLGPAPKYDPPDKAATRFSELGLSMKSGTAGGFGGDDKDAVYTAVSLLPAAAVTKLPRGLVFVRDKSPHAGGGCTTPPANAAGVYCSADHTIALFDRWLKGSQVRYARATSKVATVLHELGHAIDDANRDAHDAFARALSSDGGTAITGYGGKNTLESYAECFMLYVADPKQLEALRPNVYTYFAGAYGGTATPAGSGSGSGSAPRPTPVRTGAGSGSAARH